MKLGMMSGKKLMRSYLSTVFIILCFFLNDARSTEWTVLQTVYDIHIGGDVVKDFVSAKDTDIPNPYSKDSSLNLQCTYCNNLLQDVVVDYEGQFACKKCVKKLFKFFKENGFYVKILKEKCKDLCVSLNEKDNHYCEALLTQFPNAIDNPCAFFKMLVGLYKKFVNMVYQDEQTLYDDSENTVGHVHKKLEKLKDLLILCNDCGEVVKIGELLEHSRSHFMGCNFCKFEADAGCFKNRVDQFEEHVSLDCFPDCKLCNKKILAKNMQTHMELCQAQWVSCDRCASHNKFLLKDYVMHIFKKATDGTHLGIICCVCGGSVTNLEYFNHFEQFHKDDEISKCLYCEQSFLSNGVLITHIFNKHDTKIKELFDESVPEETLTVDMVNLKKLCKNWSLAVSQGADAHRIKALTGQLNKLTLMLQRRMTNNLRDIQELFRDQGSLTQDYQKILECFQEKVIFVSKGTYVWCIKKVSVLQKMSPCDTGKVHMLLSPFFYSKESGYLLRMYVYLHGYGEEYGKHVSAFVAFNVGNYDAILSWPFTKKITLKLINQTDASESIAHSYTGDETQPFQRPCPRAVKPLFIGCRTMCSFDVLRNVNFVKDDVMYMQCIIEDADTTEKKAVE